MPRDGSPRGSHGPRSGGSSSCSCGWRGWAPVQAGLSGLPGGTGWRGDVKQQADTSLEEEESFISAPTPSPAAKAM